MATSASSGDQERAGLATPAGIGEHDLPVLYRAADATSLEGQRRYLRATRLRLGMLLVAAVIGLFTWRTGGPDLAGVLASAAFSAALAGEVYLLTIRPERLWYDGRAAAESTKTLSWRYLAGGNPFGKDGRSEAEAEELLRRRFRELTRDLRGLPLANGGVTDVMRRLRGQPLEVRRACYRTGRIRDQRDWYERNAAWNRDRARRWALALAALEALGLTGGLLKAAAVVDVDLLGLTAALIATGVAWMQTKQHATLANAYTIAWQELATIDALIDQPATEAEWARFVEQAEDAISREHTLWRATHS